MSFENGFVILELMQYQLHFKQLLTLTRPFLNNFKIVFLKFSCL